MKFIKRLHLYLGCFFTPLLLFFLVTGFLLVWQPERVKGTAEAQTFLQRIYLIHTDQHLPVVQRPPKENLLWSGMDNATHVMTVTEPHGFKDGTAIRLITALGQLPMLMSQPVKIELREGEVLQVGGGQTNVVFGGVTNALGAHEMAVEENGGWALYERATLQPIPGDPVYYVKITGPKSFTLHEKPASPVMPIKGVPDSEVTIWEDIPSPTYDMRWFKFLIYAMVTGVVVTMVLGVYLAFRLTPDKRPVWLAMALGLIIPYMLIKGGQNPEGGDNRLESEPIVPGQDTEGVPGLDGPGIGPGTPEGPGNPGIGGSLPPGGPGIAPGKAPD